MMNQTPIIFDWTGEAMVPLGRFRKLCDKQFVVGEQYRMEAIEERSMASHRQYFAAIHDAWMNLPENIAEQYPTSEVLRKRALIEAKYYDEEILDCGTKAAALNVAPAIRRRDDFAIIHVRGQFIIIRTAKSQSMRSMGKDVFQKSKQDVLDTIAALIDVSRGTLQKEAGRSA